MCPKIAPITKGIATGLSANTPTTLCLSEDSPDHKGDCDTGIDCISCIGARIGSEDSPDHKGDCDVPESSFNWGARRCPKIAPITKGIATDGVMNFVGYYSRVRR